MTKQKARLLLEKENIGAKIRYFERIENFKKVGEYEDKLENILEILTDLEEREHYQLLDELGIEY